MPRKKIRIVLWLAVAAGLFVLGAVSVGGFGARNALPPLAAGDAASGAPLGGAFGLVDNDGATGHRGGVSRQALRALLRLHPLPRRLPDHADGDGRLGRGARRRGRQACASSSSPSIPSATRRRCWTTTSRRSREASSASPASRRRCVPCCSDYKIFSRKVPLEGGDYSMDHTASVFLQDANGQFGRHDRSRASRARRRWPSFSGLWQDRPCRHAALDQIGASSPRGCSSSSPARDGPISAPTCSSPPSWRASPTASEARRR